MDKGIPIRAISRGFAVLQAINRGQSLSMMEIARASEVPYPTACRIIQTLLHEGLIEREPSRKRYRPTALVQSLSHGFQGDAQLVHAARQHLVALTGEVGWPITLSTKVGHSMVVRDSTHALTAMTFNEYFPGFTIPILGSAAGHAYLAHIEDDVRQELFRSINLVPTEQNTHVLDLLANSGLMEQIREDGYATRDYNQFTRNPGKTSSIAVPIIKKDGVVMGSITLAFFATAIRMEDAIEAFAPKLKATAQAVTKGLE